MGSGDWSNDLIGNAVSGNPMPGDLTPAPAPRPLESQASPQDASGATRRRARQKQEEEDADDEKISSEDKGRPEHRLDHLA
jgi:hypothetical protein